MSRSLLIKVTCGAEAAERANQGLTVAATAAASGVPVSLWLAGDATGFAFREGATALDLPLATPVAELMATVLELGRVTVCGQCAARRNLTENDIADGARIAGAAGFVEEALLDGVQALVY